ncbi:hypothetical protein ACYULU_01720 [Breznakiellaceae bacterium SP9]
MAPRRAGPAVGQSGQLRAHGSLQRFGLSCCPSLSSAGSRNREQQEEPPKRRRL